MKDALGVSTDPDNYREYIRHSGAEFTVAKDQNVRLRTGWFSDRSATYLAAGRPVVTQDTGFGDLLPVGAGLFAFTGGDEIVEAVERIRTDYAAQRRSAFAIAREFFDADVVLTRLLDDSGTSVPRRRSSRSETVLPLSLPRSEMVRSRSPSETGTYPVRRARCLRIELSSTPAAALSATLSGSAFEASPPVPPLPQPGSAARAQTRRIWRVILPPLLVAGLRRLRSRRLRS